jgi:hypothetical protein
LVVEVAGTASVLGDERGSATELRYSMRLVPCTQRAHNSRLHSLQGQAIMTSGAKRTLISESVAPLPNPVGRLRYLQHSFIEPQRTNSSVTNPNNLATARPSTRKSLANPANLELRRSCERHRCRDRSKVKHLQPCWHQRARCASEPVLRQADYPQPRFRPVEEPYPLESPKSLLPHLFPSGSAVRVPKWAFSGAPMNSPIFPPGTPDTRKHRIRERTL